MAHRLISSDSLDEPDPIECDLSAPDRVEYWVPRDGEFVLATEEDMLWIRAHEAELAWQAKQHRAQLSMDRGARLTRVLAALLTRLPHGAARRVAQARSRTGATPATRETEAPSKVGTHLHDAHSR